jgi:hypothetical protein
MAPKKVVSESDKEVKSKRNAKETKPEVVTTMSDRDISGPGVTWYDLSDEMVLFNRRKFGDLAMVEGPDGRIRFSDLRRLREQKMKEKDFCPSDLSEGLGLYFNGFVPYVSRLIRFDDQDYDSNLMKRLYPNWDAIKIVRKRFRNVCQTLRKKYHNVATVEDLKEQTEARKVDFSQRVAIVEFLGKILLNPSLLKVDSLFNLNDRGSRKKKNRYGFATLDVSFCSPWCQNIIVMAYFEINEQRIEFVFEGCEEVMMVLGKEMEDPAQSLTWDDGQEEYELSSSQDYGQRSTRGRPWGSAEDHQQSVESQAETDEEEERARCGRKAGSI